MCLPPRRGIDLLCGSVNSLTVYIYLEINYICHSFQLSNLQFCMFTLLHKYMIEFILAKQKHQKKKSLLSMAFLKLHPPDRISSDKGFNCLSHRIGCFGC